MQRLLSGQNLTLGFLGASVTEGAYALDRNSESKPWPNWTQEIVMAHVPAEARSRVRLVNGAISATTSSWHSMCHHRRLTQDVDVVFIEFAINDPTGPATAIERLIRKTLMYPNRPAVVLMNWWLWHVPYLGCPVDPSGFGKAFLDDENGGEFSEVARYYEVQALSNRACCYHLMRKGVHGFKVDRPSLINSCWPGWNTSNGTKPDDPRLYRTHFYADWRHPNGYTGARVLGEMAGLLLLNAAASLKSRPVESNEISSLNMTLPPPLYPNNHEYDGKSCFLWQDIINMTLSSAGWTWHTEKGRKKWGWQTEQAGAVLEILVPAALPFSEKTQRNVTVKVNYIRSFRHMGRASVTCVSGCQCDPIEIDALDKLMSTQTDAKPIQVTPSSECLLRITSLNATSDQDGGRRFKVNGVIVLEGQLRDDGGMFAGDTDQIEHQKA